MSFGIGSYLIVTGLLFLAGIVDAIGGGGGLISLPAFLIVGVPPHMAVATNKLSAATGTLLAVIRFIKNDLISLKLAIPSCTAAMIGSFLGSKVSLLIPESYFNIILVIMLPIAAFLVLNKKLFKDNGKEVLVVEKKTYITATVAALFIGFYDGFYGPGTGTFLLIAFTVFAHLSVKHSNANAKIINCTTNITALVVFATSGKVLVLLGLVGAVANLFGGYIGSSLAMSKSNKVTKPVIIFVLLLLAIKVIREYFF
ncbi:MAG: TSUP family transporter [Lachnospiraceae bacterium]|nr:TSUP family transporter [Lachnospiraceae bacterium]